MSRQRIQTCVQSGDVCITVLIHRHAQNFCCVYKQLHDQVVLPILFCTPSALAFWNLFQFFFLKQLVHEKIFAFTKSANRQTKQYHTHGISSSYCEKHGLPFSSYKSSELTVVGWWCCDWGEREREKHNPSRPERTANLSCLCLLASEGSVLDSQSPENNVTIFSCASREPLNVLLLMESRSEDFWPGAWSAL